MMNEQAAAHRHRRHEGFFRATGGEVAAQSRRPLDHPPSADCAIVAAPPATGMKYDWLLL